MPIYGTASTPPTLTRGALIALFAAEAATATKKSQQFGMRRNDAPVPLSVEIKFSADPGNFSISLQTADTDADAYYVNSLTVTQTGMNSTFVCRIESLGVVARFARLSITSITNAVNVTATVC